MTPDASRRTEIERKIIAPSRTGINEAFGCWVHPNAAQSKGYVQVYMCSSRKLEFVHRLAYEYARGPIPTGLLVCHTCDVRRCCNPEHLFLGSAKDNYRDSVAKSRNTRGEVHGCSKLTDRQVIDIRLDLRPRSVIAMEYGISVGTLSDIKLRKTWKHLKET